MKAFATGWPGAVVANLLVVALFFYRDSPIEWEIIVALMVGQGLLTLWALRWKGSVSANGLTRSFNPEFSGPTGIENVAEATTRL
jgi:hypothetical protein